MQRRDRHSSTLIFSSLSIFLFASSLALGQAQPQRGQLQGEGQPWPASPPAYTAGAARAVDPGLQPDQPVVPVNPTIERRPAAIQGPAPVGAMGVNPAARPAASAAPPIPPPVPFVLSQQEQLNLDHTLADWEKRNKEVKSFDANFTRWEFDGVFGKPNEAKFIDQGQIKYAAPDKGLFKIDGERAEQWISDGNSIFEFKYKSKVMIEHRLPAELRGKAIADGPLPFVFGTESIKLKQRYFMRVITPRDAQGEIWLEAYPRHQRDAADFKKAELILKADGMSPFAIQIYSPNGKDRTVYQFDNIVVNRRGRWLPGDFGNPFRASAPFGWQTQIEEPPTPQQASRPAVGR